MADGFLLFSREDTYWTGTSWSPDRREGKVYGPARECLLDAERLRAQGLPCSLLFVRVA